MNLERNKSKKSRGGKNTKWDWWNSGKGSAMGSLCTGLNRGTPPLSRPTKGSAGLWLAPISSSFFLVIHNGYHMVQKCMSERRDRPVQAEEWPQKHWDM